MSFFVWGVVMQSGLQLSMTPPPPASVSPVVGLEVEATKRAWEGSREVNKLGQRMVWFFK